MPQLNPYADVFVPRLWSSSAHYGQDVLKGVYEPNVPVIPFSSMLMSNASNTLDDVNDNSGSSPPHGLASALARLDGEGAHGVATTLTFLLQPPADTHYKKDQLDLMAPAEDGQQQHRVTTPRSDTTDAGSTNMSISIDDYHTATDAPLGLTADMLPEVKGCGGGAGSWLEGVMQMGAGSTVLGCNAFHATKAVTLEWDMLE
ncbi:unnamed protein product [Vitrella brassicaformis CCMP3155]|uniref:Uncharacterized protein n=1 Tax=Vitrella brassicaformis (strain CCMP3155) TaxID=1169540 RepID=A0A0G4EPK6_VITBC|nr:unnamed protein product [Vitrella brassicaformis CCMP3155]|eukprot:CEL99491.1 unnamed protein product [Vitrella brassicaformis CCMP3155]